MRIAMLLAGMLLLLGAAPASRPTPIRANTFVRWDAAADETWSRGGLTTSLSSVADGDGGALPVWTVSSPGRTPLRHVFKDHSPMGGGYVAIGSLARGQAESAVVQLWTGGAHCCWHLLVATPTPHGFHVVDVEKWDDRPARWPRDLNRDGIADFENIDSQFQYAFGSYDCCNSPPQILNIRKGRAVNVSTDPSFAPVFAADQNRVAHCVRDGGQAACALYAADAARAGHFARDWPKLLRYFTQPGEDDWTYNDSQWEACRLKLPEPYCRKTYTATLKAFLRVKGYLR